MYYRCSFYLKTIFFSLSVLSLAGFHVYWLIVQLDSRIDSLLPAQESHEENLIGMWKTNLVGNSQSEFAKDMAYLIKMMSFLWWDGWLSRWGKSGACYLPWLEPGHWRCLKAALLQYFGYVNWMGALRSAGKIGRVFELKVIQHLCVWLNSVHLWWWKLIMCQVADKRGIPEG